jgi:hypothetical protein
MIMGRNVLRIYFIMLFLLVLSLGCYSDDGIRESLSLDGTWQIIFEISRQRRLGRLLFRVVGS